MNILQIEDNDRNAYLVHFLLTAGGHEVDRAADGPSGLERAAKGAYDLVLLDIQLPGMDGYAVARALREIPHDRRPAIVAVTSYAMGGDREKALEAGCDGYIEKPIDPSTFWSDILNQAPWLNEIQ